MFDSISSLFSQYTSQTIFFLVFLAAAIPILVYYRRRNPNPRFRPTAGEMSVVSLFAVAICMVFAVSLGGLFNKEQDLRKLSERPTVDSFSGGDDGDDSGSSRRPKDSKKGGSKTDPFQEYLLHQAAGGR